MRCTSRYDKLIIDDHVFIYNDSERRIERLPFSVYSTATSGHYEAADDEGHHLSRRRQQRYPTNAAMSAAQSALNAANKRSQSVESLLNRIPKMSSSPQSAATPRLPAASSAWGLNGANDGINVSMSNPSSKSSTDSVLTVTLNSEGGKKFLKSEVQEVDEEDVVDDVLIAE